MLSLSFLAVVIVLYILCDVNYVIRTLFTLYSSKLYQRNLSPADATTIYGICTFQDCGISGRSVRLTRLIRDLDFARYHYYDRTGLWRRMDLYKVKIYQGSTFTVTGGPVPLFSLYKIITKLVYWDEVSLFFEHEVVTVRDGIVRSVLISRQQTKSDKEDKMTSLFECYAGFNKPTCPEYIKPWLTSLQVTSKKLRNH